MSLRRVRFMSKAAVVMMALVAPGLVERAAGIPKVRVSVVSEVEEELGVFWIDTAANGALVRQTAAPIAAKGALNLDSYVGHNFLIVDEEFADEFTRYDADVWDPEIMAFITMGEYDMETTIRRSKHDELEVEVEDVLTRTADLVEDVAEDCMEDPLVQESLLRQDALLAAHNDSCPAEEEDLGVEAGGTSPEFVECLSDAIAEDVAKKEAEATFNIRVLRQVGDRARNYTCNDPSMETTKNTLREFAWLDAEEGKSYNTKVFLDQPAAKIFLVDDFIPDDVCEVLTNVVQVKEALVGVGGGEPVVSSERRAKAGAVKPSLDPRMSSLFRRAYDFASNVTGHNLTTEGQEDITMVKYDTTDEYMPHCDGDCTGTKFKTGGRVASMVMFCETAELGGGTTFSSADVFIQGKVGQAVFFSYLDLDGRTDTGFTRYSECPVVEGTKWVATIWMRSGVTEEKGWQYYDATGIPIKYTPPAPSSASDEDITYVLQFEPM